MSMDSEEFKEIFDRQIKQCADTLIEKAKEYAHEDDRLRNFRIASSLTEETPEQAIWGFCVKHIVSVSDMVQSDGEYTTAQWDEKIGDAINYLILLRAQVFETQMGKTATAVSVPDAREFATSINQS